MPDIDLPYAYTPRDYQMPVWQAFDSGLKRLLLIWHRRSGKDKTSMNILARAMMQRVGTYFYFFPTFTQARRVVWNGMDKEGFRFINHIPQDLWEGPKNETEMRIRLKNGSVFQLVGSDNIDHIVGTNPVGCLFSEYSLQDPNAWDYIRPILRENEGWALFNGTPRGKHNHMFTMYEMAKDDPDWFVSKLGADETQAISEEDIDAERRSGMDEELIQQEFYVSFDGGMSGGFYIEAMKNAETQGRITDVPHDAMMPVYTAWDLGIDDVTSVIFFQQSPAGQIRIIDYHESSGEGLGFYANMLQDKADDLGYTYADHLAPWDINTKELGTGKTRLEIARSLGVHFKVVRRLSIEDGINAVRMSLGNCWFDKTNCQRLVEAMFSYSKTWDKQYNCWRAKPRHDWASHGADAFRYMCCGRPNAYKKRTMDRYERQMYSRASRSSWMTA